MGGLGGPSVLPHGPQLASADSDSLSTSPTLHLHVFPDCLPLWALSPGIRREDDHFGQSTYTCLGSKPSRHVHPGPHLSAHRLAQLGFLTLLLTWEETEGARVPDSGSRCGSSRGAGAGTRITWRAFKPQPPPGGWIPPPEVLILRSGGGAQIFAFLVGSQVMLILAVWGEASARWCAPSQG